MEENKHVTSISTIDQLRLKAAWISLGVGIIIFILKVTAWKITQSSAILSDALESVVHIFVTACVVYLARLSAQPPDENHPYGHGKAEHFSVGIEGGMIFIAGLGVVWKVIENMQNKVVLNKVIEGFGIIGVAALINLFLGFWLIRQGKKLNSPLLKADGQHVLVDVITTGGVILGLGLVMITGITQLDYIVAFIVAGFMAFGGIRLLREAIRGLMDEADPEVLQKVVDTINSIREDEWRDIHNLRASNHGGRLHIDFHLVLPPEWTVVQGHESMDHLEAAILKRLEKPGSVIIHMDPHLDPEAKERYQTLVDGKRQPFSLEQVTRIVPDQGHHISKQLENQLPS